MPETLFYVLSSFWVGAVHAATPGHGKTIAAAYIVGARGRPIDAVILGVFVTLSHTTGIVLVGVLASLGSAWLVPQRVEAYLALATGLLVVALGLWMLWTQRDLLAQAMGAPLVAAPADGAGHDHHHPGNYPHHHHHDDNLGHRDGAGLAWHSHGWGTVHSHRLDLVMVAPGIEHQPVRSKPRHPGADFGPGVHMGRRVYILLHGKWRLGTIICSVYTADRELAII